MRILNWHNIQLDIQLDIQHDYDLELMMSCRKQQHSAQQPVRHLNSLSQTMWMLSKQNIQSNLAGVRLLSRYNIRINIQFGIHIF